jgi:predicted RNA-binding protein with PUA-like domain
MNHFLVKTEPSVYSFQQLIKDGTTTWDGIRNYAARLHLNAMKKGDKVLVYHTGDEKQIVGIAQVTKPAFADPTDKTGEWVAVGLAPVTSFKKPVTLASVKADSRLKSMALVRVGRLSVMPVTKEEFEIIVKLGNS